MAKEVYGRPRKRGRPPGSGSINDTPQLIAVADLLAAKKVRTPRAAMRSVVKGLGDSHLRRLQAKWKDQGEALLAAAQERIRRRREATKEGLVVTLDRRAWSLLPLVPSLTEGWSKAMASGCIKPVALPRAAMEELSPLVGRLSPPPASVAEIPDRRISGAMAEVVNPLGRAFAAADELRGGSRLVSLGTSPLLDAVGAAGRAHVRDAPVLGLRDPLLSKRR